MNPSRDPIKLQVMALLALFILTVFLSFKSPFINEDYTKIYRNQSLNTMGLIEYVTSTEAAIEDSYFRPVNNALTWVINRLAGNQHALPYRAAGILSLFIMALAAARLSYILFRNSAASWVALLLPVIHPFNSWYLFQGSWTANTLSVTLAIIWTAILIRCCQSGQISKQNALKLSLTLTAAMICKESAVLAPVALIPFLLLHVRNFRSLSAFAVSLIIPCLLYAGFRYYSVGNLWGASAENLQTSFMNTADILIQYLLTWVSGTNFNYAKEFPLILGVGGSVAAALGLLIPVLLMLKGFRMQGAAIWVLMITAMEGVIGYSHAAAVVCTRWTLFTAASAVLISGLFTSAGTVPVKTRFKEAAIPPLIILLAWYAIQTAQHLKLSRTPENFYSYHTKDPNGWRLLFAYGDYLLDDGEIEPAIRHLESSLDHRNFTIILNSLGIAYAKKGLNDKAKEVFLEAHKQNPSDIYPIKNLGRLFLLENKFYESFSYFLMAYEISPSDEDNLLYLSNAFMESDVQQRILMLPMMEKIRSPELIMALGRELSRRDLRDEAVYMFRIAIRQDSGSSRAYTLLGMEYGRLNMISESREAFKHALKINPDNAETYNAWGILEARNGDLKESIRIFTAGLKVQPDHQQMRKNLNQALRQIKSGDT